MINNPVTFGLRLGVGYARCKQLIKDISDVNAQVQEIAAEWYSQSPRPTWNEVVEALYRQGFPEIAAHLASKVGVESPVSQQDGDTGHH